MSLDVFGVSTLGATILSLEPHPDGVCLRVEATSLSVLVPIGRDVAAALGRRLVELAAAPPAAAAPFGPFPVQRRTLADVMRDEASHDG
ncbi:hypothetical protein STVA_41650 [Allostella vacuolata]|nr:hypothetical protein STVA_41650 [Stella vacuolata]